MRNILEQIVDTKRDELQVSQRARPIAALQQMPLYHSPGPSAVERVRTGNATGIIAEFKRRSPSKGWIHEQADPVQVTTGYAKGGAAAISVLTDEQYFGGALHDLLAVRQAVDVPLLRKDFTINAYQLHEARAYGANIILLIAAILSPSQVQEFAEEAHSIGLEVLLELHGEEELEHICPAVDMVGINNRNLKNFEVNIDHSIRMVKQLPSHTIKVAESGIHNAEVAATLLHNGFDALLMGEYFMKRPDPAIAFASFANELNSLKGQGEGSSPLRMT